MQSHNNFEVVVVLGPCDHGDDSREILTNISDLRYYETEFKNISHARNIGLYAVSGEYVAFIDDDAIPEPNWLENLVLPFENPEVGIVGGSVRLPNGIDFQFQGAYVDSLGVDQKITLNHEIAPSQYTPIGANFAVRRSAALLVAGFDNVFAYYFDETDFARRIEAAGFKAFHTNRAEVIHFQGVGIYRSNDGRPTSYLGIARSKIYFALKHGITEYTFFTIQEYLEDYKQHVLDSLDLSHQFYNLSSERTQFLKDSFLQGFEEGFSYAIKGSPIFQYLSNSDEFRIFQTNKNLESVVISCRSFDSLDSGIGVWTNQIASELSRIGHAITVIAETESSESVTFESPGYWVHRVNPSLSSNLSIPGHVSSRNSAVARSFQDITTRRNVDVFQYPIWDVEGIEVDITPLGSIKTVVSLHTTYGMTLNDHPEWFHKGKLNLPYRNLLELEKKALIKADMILANSTAIQLDIEKFYEIAISHKTTVIPHGVTQKIVSMEPPDSDHIVFLGRLEKRKGIDTFLEAIAVYARLNEIKNLKVSIIGKETDYFNTGAWLEEHEDLDFIRFEGFLENEAVARVLQTKPIVCMPSRYESFGLVALEAMSYGCVVVASRVGGLPEVVQHNSTGFTFESENAEELAMLITKLRNSPELSSMLSFSAFDVSHREFSDIAIAHRISTFYQEETV
jgi:glycosyltransferase involved in cell wall biosynthesis